MTVEKALFTVSEDDRTEEIFVVAEDAVAGGMISPKVPNMVPMNIPQNAQMAKDKKEEDEDWLKTKDPKHFTIFIIKELNRMPKVHSVLGNRSLLEQAIGQLKKLDSHISSALRSDYDNVIDAAKVDEARKGILKNIDDCEDALMAMDQMHRQKRKMRRAEDEQNGLMKEAGTAQFQGIQQTITAFEKAIVTALINSVVSGGKNIEHMYEKAKKKYKFTDREELAIMQLLADFGYPVFKDRLTLGEEVDVSEPEETGEWQANYIA